MISDVTITYNIQLRSITFCKYELKVGERMIPLTFPQLLQLRAKLNSLTLKERLTEIIENDNFVLLFLADNSHLLYLEISQLLDLKDEIAFFFKDVNSFSF